MKIIYETGDLVKVRRITEITDPALLDMTDVQFADLLNASYNDDEFVITSDNGNDYYDVKHLRSGKTIENMCVYHIYPAASSSGACIELDILYGH